MIKSLFASQSERAHSQSANVGDDTTRQQKSTANKCDELCGSHVNSEVYPSEVPYFEMRNTRLAAVSIKCTSADVELVNRKRACGGSSLILQSQHGEKMVKKGMRALSMLFPMLNKYLVGVHIKYTIMCRKYCSYVEDIKYSKCIYSHFQSYEMDEKEYARSLYKRRTLSNAITGHKQNIATIIAQQTHKRKTHVQIKHGKILDNKVFMAGKVVRLKDNHSLSLRDGILGRNNDEIMFHLDKFISFIYAIKNSSNFTQFMCITNLYLGIYFNKSVLTMFYDYFEELFGLKNSGLMDVDGPYDWSTMPPRQYENQTKTFDDVKNVVKVWGNIKNSESVAKVYKFVSLILATGLCSQNHLKFDIGGFNLFHVKASERVENLTDIVEVVMETAIYFLERGYDAFQSGDAWRLLYSDNTLLQYEKDVSFVLSRVSLIETDRLEDLGMDLLEYEKLLESVLIRTHEYLKITPPSAQRNVLTSKLQQIDRVMVKMIQVRKNTSIRVKPFSLLLFGGSGVGKTTMLNPMLHLLMSVNGFPTGGNSICTLNASDKYQSDYSSSVTSVVIDDIANATFEAAEGNHCQLIIDFINNDPKNCLKADVDSKGSVMIKPKFVIGTTNRKDLMAYHYSNEPVSIARRFDYTITVEVHPDFKQEDNDMLDGNKVQDGVPDCWCFTVERVCPIKQDRGKPDAIGYKPVKWGRQTLVGIRMPLLLAFLSDVSKKHFVLQDKLVQTSTSIFDVPVCSCGNYRQFCICDRVVFGNLENQSRLTENLTQVETWIMSQRYLYHFMRFASLCRLTLTTLSTYFSRDRSYMSKAWWFLSSTAALYWLIFYWTIVGVTSSVIAGVYIGIQELDTKCQKTIEKCDRVQNVLEHFNMRDRVKNAKVIRIMGYGIVTISTLYGIREMYRRYRKFTNHGNEYVTPPPDEVQRENVWKKAHLEPIPVSEACRTTTHTQLVSKVSSVLAYVMCEEYRTGRKFASNVFPICSNVWVLNQHAINMEEVKMTFIRRDPTKVGSNFSCIVSPVHMYKIPDSELLMMYVPNGGDNKNMIDYFPLIRRGKVSGATLVYKDENAQIRLQRVRAHPKVVASSTITTSGYAYVTEYPTFLGQCMSVLVSDDITPRILGFHFAGNTGVKQGAACSITQDEIRAGLNALENRYGVCLSNNSGTFILEPQGDSPNVKLLNNIHEKSPTNFLDEGASLIAYGAHTGSRRNFTSLVVSSYISTYVAEVFGVPNMHGPPPNMNKYHPWVYDLNNMSHVKSFSPTLIMLASRSFEDKINDNLDYKALRNVSPLSRESCLAGADGVRGIDSINLSTSMGHPWNQPKNKYLTRTDISANGVSQTIDCPQWVWDEVEKSEATLSRGERCYWVMRASLKDEPTKITKNKVRVVCGAPIHCLLLVRMYFLPVAKVIMDNSELFECAVGINAHGPEWTKFTQHVTQYGEDRMIAGDYKDYDSTMPPALTLAAFQILINMARKAGYSEKQLEIMKGIATEICYPVYEYNGEFVQINGSNPSGHPLTVFINSFANSLYIRCAYYHIYSFDPLDPFDDHVTLMCYGDDNIMSVSEHKPEFNHTSIAEAMECYGVTYTMAEKGAASVPYIHISECTFLKRRMVWNEEMGLYFGPLEESSLYKTLHSNLKSKLLTPAEHSVECINCVLTEYFLFGEEIYNDRLEKMTRVCQLAGLMHYFDGELPTYVDQYDLYVGRYLKDGCSKNPVSSRQVGIPIWDDPNV